VAERTRELREANERLHDLDRLKSDFVATMNHELRTPLNAVLGFTSLLLEGHSGPLNDTQREQLGHVGRAGRHLLALISDVLDLSRLDSGRMNLSPQDFDLAALVCEVAAQLQPAATAKGLALAQTLPPVLPLRADRRRVMQVLLNLAGNALKFTAAGEVRLFASEQAEGVAFGVEDTGVGIPAHRLSELFEPFRQLDEASSGAAEGTGLGLYLSRRLVEVMGGRIEVRSTVGVGSCFTVHLPAAPGDLAR
jgi:signal transduction histidine kinase